MTSAVSAMTTSENFSLSARPRCPTESPWGASLAPLDKCDRFLTDSDFGGGVFESNSSGIPSRGQMTKARKEAALCPDFHAAPTDEIPKFELETEMGDLLEQLDMDDVPCDQSRQWKIDPNFLKLNISNLTLIDLGGRERVESSASPQEDPGARIERQNKRASHHLSGGGLLSDASQTGIFQSFPEAGAKSQFCKLSDGGCISTENIFDFDDLNYFKTPAAEEEQEQEQDEPSPGFANQISPSSPLTFDLAPGRSAKSAAKGDAANAQSANPFSRFAGDAAEGESLSASTNPFSNPNCTSSLTQQQDSRSPDYENLNVCRKSFSRCSTRPSSPVGKSNPEESCISNPFLLNQTSPRSHQSVSLGGFVVDDRRFPVRQSPLSHSSANSIIFAVPVFPIFQHHISDSGTRTGGGSAGQSPPAAAEEPIYQNVTNQLRKFMLRNNHSEYDLQCLKTTMKDLRNSGWYYENVSWQESVVLLRNTEPGTFLIRDSSDPNFLFSLSVQTSRGPTSVRLHYVNGQFRLDAEEKLVPHMPSFNSVIELIDYYIENTVKNKLRSSSVGKSSRESGKDKSQRSKEQVWIDSQGKMYSNILLVKPLYKKDHFCPLQHLARLTINKHMKKNLKRRSKVSFRVTPVYESSPFESCSFPVSLDNFCPILNVDALPLPATLLYYLKDYPYCH